MSEALDVPLIRASQTNVPLCQCETENVEEFLEDEHPRPPSAGYLRPDVDGCGAALAHSLLHQIGRRSVCLVGCIVDTTLDLRRAW